MKLGLTLEGGASRTMFSCGVMDALLEENIIADFVIGVSAGSVYAMSYVSGQNGRNLTLSQKYMNDKRYLGFKYMFKPKNNAYYNIDFVFDEVPNKLLPYDYEAFEKFPGEVYAVVTNIETGKPEYLPMPRNDKKWKLGVASCSLPIMFPPVEIDGKKYLDGGITDAIPVDNAIEHGCDKNIVLITREREYIKEKESGVKLAAFLYRKFPKFAEAVKRRAQEYNKSHAHLLELEKEGKAFVFAPDNTEGWRRTESDPEKLRMMYEAGYNMAKKRMPELKEYLNK